MCANGSGPKGDVVECIEVGRLAGPGFCSLTDLSNSPQGGKGARDNLGHPIAIDGIGSLRFQQLGVHEHDSELIIQATAGRLELHSCGDASASRPSVGAGRLTRESRGRSWRRTLRRNAAQAQHRATAYPRRSGWIRRPFGRIRPYRRKSSCKSCDGSLQQPRRPS